MESDISKITDQDTLDFIERNKTKVWERDGKTSIFSDEDAKKILEELDNKLIEKREK